MKIMKRKQFMELPAGTVYAYYEPTNFRGWSVKQSTGGLDFFNRDLIDFSNKTFDSLPLDGSDVDPEQSFPLDFQTGGREGLFDEEKLYAILEPHDVKALIASLQNALLESQGITEALDDVTLPVDLVGE